MDDSLHLLLADSKQERRKDLEAVLLRNRAAHAVGRRIEKIDPLGNRGVRPIVPPCASTAHLAISRPSPAPPASRVRPSSTRKTRSNTRDALSWGIPRPSSSIARCTNVV